MKQNSDGGNPLFVANQFYKIPEVSMMIGLTPSWVARQVSNKKIPAYRVARHWLLRGCDLNAFFEAKRTRVCSRNEDAA